MASDLRKKAVLMWTNVNVKFYNSKFKLIIYLREIVEKVIVVTVKELLISLFEKVYMLTFVNI